MTPALATPKPNPNYANPKNPPREVMDAVSRLSDEQLARLWEFTLCDRRHRLAESSGQELVAELAWWQRVDQQSQIHMNRVGEAIYEGRHPKHWLWRSHKQWIVDRIRPGDRVLDVGCGASAYLLWMAERGASVTAIDVNPARIEQARSIMSHPGLTFDVCDVISSPPRGRFDVAICSHVIEHLDDPVQLLSALRTCVPRLIVAVPPEDSRWQKVMFKDLGLPWKDDEDHRREYTPALLRSQAEAAGWRIEELHAGIDIKALAIPAPTP